MLSKGEAVRKVEPVRIEKSKRCLDDGHVLFQEAS
jgi:hypothetical protein